MEENNKQINISQKAIICRQDGKILAIKRSNTHPLRPKGWDIPGGDLEFGEDMEEGIVREIREETGMEIYDLKIIDAVSRFNSQNEFWVVICYIAKPKIDEVKLSWEHNDFEWATCDEFLQLDVLPHIKEFVKKLEL